MEKENNKSFRSKVYNHLFTLAQESPAYEDAKMLVGSAETVVSLKNNTVHRSIDTEWIEKIEYTIPYLDAYIRTPGIAIQEIEEVLPVEVTKKVSEKSIRYLSQHTNHILKIEGDEVTPSKLLNIFRDETYLTYENKFINTLLVRLIAFIEKRFSVLDGTSSIEKNYVFDYQTSFDHSLVENEKNTAKMTLKIELSSPVKNNLTEEEEIENYKYIDILQRLNKIRLSIMSYMSSPLITAVGRNYIRPPVIRTNPILKNKNLKECLTLWEYIESVDKAGFSTITDEFKEMPSDDYVYDFYSTMALQYMQFYSGVVGEDADNRLLGERRLTETFPDFDSGAEFNDADDYSVYDSEYKKTVTVSSLAERRRKLSADERKMRTAVEVALRADRILFDEFKVEDQARKEAEEERIRQEQERIRLEEQRLAMLERRKNINYHYVRTYIARLIQSDDLLKQDYEALKNKLLSYSKVKCRISKKCETFYLGRTVLAKLDVKGKKIYFNLALNPSEFAEKAKYYGFIDATSKKPDTPMLMKVNGINKLKRAIELIKILMESKGIMVNEKYQVQDFYMPYEETDVLVRRGLIIDLTGETPMEEPEVQAEETIEEVTTEEEIIAEVVATEEVATEETLAEEVKVKSKLAINAKYSRTYLARLIQSEDNLKQDYSAIKNKLLSYAKVKCRTSKKCETFYAGRTTLAKLDVKGKKLNLYLALNPSDYIEKSKYYGFNDISTKKADTPMLVKVSGPIKLKRALALIDILMENKGIALNDNYQSVDFYMPYNSTEELIQKGLIIDLASKVQLGAEDYSEKVEEIAVGLTEEVTESQTLNEVPNIQLHENEYIIDGVNFVFKPYFNGYKNSNAVVIPLKKTAFDKLKDAKKSAIINSALKKNQKKAKKSIK